MGCPFFGFEAETTSRIVGAPGRRTAHKKLCGTLSVADGFPCLLGVGEADWRI